MSTTNNQPCHQINSHMQLMKKCEEIIEAVRVGGREKERREYKKELRSETKQYLCISKTLNQLSPCLSMLPKNSLMGLKCTHCLWSGRILLGSHTIASNCWRYILQGSSMCITLFGKKGTYHKHLNI